MANRGPLAAVLIVDPIISGRTSNPAGFGASALAPFARGNGAGTNGGTLTGNAVLTASEVLSGFYTANGGSSNRTVTLPSFADLTDAETGVCKAIGDRFDFMLYNAGATNNLTLTGVANVTIIVSDTNDNVAAPSHLIAASLVRVSSTDIVVACDLYG